MISIRWLRPTDLPQVVQLVREGGFPPRSEAGWHWALFGNPQQGDQAPGLVAERDGRVVSMIGLQVRRFMVKGQPRELLSGHTFLSAADGRGAGFSLARAVLALEGYDAIYSLNNNAAAGKFHKRMGLSAWLGSAARIRMEWPVHSVTMAAGLALSRLSRLERSYEILSRREWFAGGASRLDRYHPSGNGVVQLDPETAADARLIDEFGTVITRLHTAAPVRSANLYAYQAGDPDAPGRTVLFGLQGRDGLDGLAQVMLTKPNAFEPAELVLTDLEVRPGRDGVRIVPALIREVKALARQKRLSRVRLPYAHRFDPVCFHGTGLRFPREAGHDPAHAIFADPAGQLATDWVPTGFEGDYFFALRTAHPPAPKPERARARKALPHSAME